MTLFDARVFLLKCLSRTYLYYKTWAFRSPPTQRYYMKTCTQPDCSQPHFGLGLCKMHHTRKRRGSPPMDAPRQPRENDREGWTHGDRHRHYLYRLTPEQFLTMSPVCEICGGSEYLAVDHDHESGKVRGKLCANCNRALGLLKDDPARVEAMFKYLLRDW